MGYQPIPAATTTLCRYVSFLAKKLKYNSIKQYLNYVRILHCERNLPNPLENNFLLTHTMKGIRRCLGVTVVRKKPVTPDMLKCIIKNLDLKKPFVAAVWALCLTMFYGFLRRSNVMAPSCTKFDGSKHLRRQDILFYPWGILIHLRWSKVIQYQTRTFDIPLPRLSGNVLCPVTALIIYLHLTSGADLSGPAFVYPVNSQLKPVTSEIFIGRVRECLSSEAVNQLDIATHSFRRGAVSFSHLSGLSADSIKLMGDWRSGCYASYIDNSVTTRLELIRNMQSNL